MSSRASLILSCGIVLSGALIAWGLNSFHQPTRFVIVKGLAEQTVTANQAIWQIRFSNNGQTLKTLYQNIADSQKTIQHFLTQQGFAANNIHFSPAAVTDNDANQYSNHKPLYRFKADTTLSLTTPQVSKLKSSIRKTSDLIAQNILIASSNVRYRFTELNQLKPKMLQTATQNAEKAGETFAHNSGSALGTILYASQGLFSIQSADGSYGDNDIHKTVRVVSTVKYALG